MTTEATPRATKPEGLFGALATFIVVALVFGVVVSVFGLKLQRADAQALFDELLPGDAPLPLGLVHSGGTATAGEQRWVVLKREAVDHAEWPAMVVLGRYADPGPAGRHFTKDRENLPRDLTKELEKWKEKPYEFHATTRRGEIEFGSLRSEYKLERTFLADGTFFDIARVNLSIGTTGQILEAHWDAGFEGATVETLVPLLERLTLVDKTRSEPSAAIEEPTGTR